MVTSAFYSCIGNLLFTYSSECRFNVGDKINHGGTQYKVIEGVYEMHSKMWHLKVIVVQS